MQYAVLILEYEMDWGSRVDEICIFDDYDSAKTFQEEFNSHNKESEPPKWYMTAENPVPW